MIKTNNKKSFASDNNSGIHPEILKSITEANVGDAVGYGDDIYTEQAIACFKKQFGNETDVYFVFNGTAANTLGLKLVTNPYNSIICSEYAHINVNECGAPDFFTGCKLQPVASTDGKITVSAIAKYMHSIGDEHHVQPKVISISQVTELGTVYSVDEIKKLADYAHANEMYMHLDGARIANAAAALDVSFRQMTRDAGVDIVSFGATKNGCLSGEAVLIFNPKLSVDFKYIRKQGMQLASKMRYTSAQFIAYFENDLWKKNALNANLMALYLCDKIKSINVLSIQYPVESNAVFVKIPEKIIEPLKEKYFFYVWDEEQSIVRWMTSFNTTKKDIDDFISVMSNLL